MRVACAAGIALLAAASAAAPQITLLAYLGGAGTDDCDGIAIDLAGDIYLACHSDSPDFPGAAAKAGAPARAAMDAVVVKIAGKTGHLLWATRTGGSDWDAVGDILVRADGSIYAIGSTRSADFPITHDAVQRRFGGPERDGILIKLDPKGKIVYSTFLGGSGNDEATTMAVADDGTVYVGGITRSPDFPGSRVAKFGSGGQADGFIARLRPGDPDSLQTVIVGGSGVEHQQYCTGWFGQRLCLRLHQFRRFPGEECYSPSYRGAHRCLSDEAARIRLEPAVLHFLGWFENRWSR